MAGNIGQSPANSKDDERGSFDGYDSGGNKIKAKKKQVNSWDCSSSDTDDPSPKIKISDWDASSDCHETMVEPFEDKPPKETNSDSNVIGSPKEIEIGQLRLETKSISASHSSFDSPDLSILDVSGRNSIDNMFEVTGGQQNNSKKQQHRSFKEDLRRKEEDSLLVEDIEEFIKEGSGREMLESDRTSTSDKENDSNRSQGTAGDTTIWMIPKSDRTSCSASNSRLVTASESQDLEKLDRVSFTVKKAKSSSSVEKRHRRKHVAKSSRSDCLNNLDWKRAELTNFPMNWEGSSFHQKSKIQNKRYDKTGECFDEPRVYFTEYECRTVTTDNDGPEKPTEPTLNTDQEGESRQGNENVENSNETQEAVAETGEENVGGHHNLMLAGPSTQTSLEVVSLPDIIGRNSAKERQAKEKLLRRINSPGKPRVEPEQQPQPAMRPRNESWFLMDETGQYQPVTRDEVTILLNGRSAEAVLQGHKEHFIQSPTLPNMASQNVSIGEMLTKESIQNILREEDRGGEGPDKKPIDLERKVENTLLYIQPGINLTASIRIIPVDTEMIHIWRRSRDNGSLLSSEVDLRLQPSQDSVENSRLANDHHMAYPRRITIEKTQQTVAEQDENLDMTNGNIPNANENPMLDYSKLLIETRMIVDNLTNNFRLLQTRLDGETNKSSILQGEVQKLRKLLKVSSEKSSDSHDKETLDGPHRSHSSSYSSVVSVAHEEKLVEKNDNEGTGAGSENATFSLDPSNDIKTSEETINDNVHVGADYITVNIYTTEDNLSHHNASVVQETNSLLQANLGIIEGKMKRLEQENDVISKQNTELKEKLKEISLELEKYLTNTTETDEGLDEDKDKDTLRDQVCNLKLELDNLKKAAKNQERRLTIENTIMKEKLQTNLINLEEWLAMSDQVFREMENLKSKLGDNTILKEDSRELKKRNVSEPKTFYTALNFFIREVTDRLIALQNENWLYEATLEKNCREKFQQDDRKSKNEQNEALERVISGYENLIEQCRRGAMSSGDQVLEDYFAIIMEKASLMDELKILKTENEMLAQDHADLHTKLKQSMIALKDHKQEIVALQSAQKLSEEEKMRMLNMLKSYEDQRSILEKDISEKTNKITELLQDNKDCQLELAGKKEKLETAEKEIENLNKSCQLKDDMIHRFKIENEELQRMEGMKKNQIDALKAEINELEIQKAQLDSDITTIRLMSNQSQKETTEYINHLETIVSSSQETLEKNKQKLKDTNQIMARLKMENEALERQIQCDLKLHNKTKEELEACREKLASLGEINAKIDEEKEKLLEKLQTMTDSERKTSEILDSLKKEMKILQSENESLKERVEIYFKDRDESLKEQKDLINKYAILSKELQKLREKYRHVKTECNERTNVIQYLEMMLRENAHDYNNKIAYLENNITHILDKIAACKHSMREKHVGVDAQVRELQEQLNITCQQRLELENVVDNYHTVMKHLENKIQDREKELDELQVALSLEQQKWMNNSREVNNELPKYENNQEIKVDNDRDGRRDSMTIERLENDVLAAENELRDCKKKLKEMEVNHENEKRKLELVIADLKSEINRYQLRIEVMMKNLSNNQKNLNVHISDKKNTEEITRKLHILTKEAEVKDGQIAELNDAISKLKITIKMKENEMETLEKKNYCMSEMLKNLQNHVSKMEATLFATNKSSERQQKEKNEIAEKLLQSIKMIMEEKSARQSIELLSVEREKNYKEQLDHLKSELQVKTKNYSTLSDENEAKKKFILKLQHDLKKIKLENASLKSQLNEDCSGFKQWEDQVLHKSNSLTQMKMKNFSPERLESCLKELKEIRDVNLMLRKTEGEYQAKIVRLEDEIRDARLVIKELEGGIKIEKKSKKALKNMILSAKMEINKCLIEKQIISMVADRINRHLDLEDIHSRSFRGPHKSNSSESYS